MDCSINCKHCHFCFPAIIHWDSCVAISQMQWGFLSMYCSTEAAFLIAIVLSLVNAIIQCDSRVSFLQMKEESKIEVLRFSLPIELSFVHARIRTVAFFIRKWRRVPTIAELRSYDSFMLLDSAGADFYRKCSARMLVSFLNFASRQQTQIQNRDVWSGS